MRRALPEILASLGAIAAGIYLLAAHVSGDLEPLARGIGLYFVACGIYWGRS